MKLCAPIAAVGLCLFGSVFAAADEYRGFWADGFNDGIRTPQQTDTLIQRLQESNCNALWAQVRKRGDAQYRSHYEPWARENPDHWDALAYLLQKAHASNPCIEVHAWINTCAVGGDSSPKHILKKHPEFISLSDKGEDYDNEATKIDPGNPGAADWTFRVYLDVLRNYDVDGIHFDFVRFGGGHWGYNPVSVAWFNALHNRIGKPAFDDPEFQQWRRENLTNLVRKVYVHSKTLKPKVAVSAATITWGNGPKDLAGWIQSSAYRNVYQDWRGWMEEGILDINCPMMYFSNSKRREYWLNWNEFAKNNKFSGRVVIGSGIWLNSIPDTMMQIEDLRKPSSTGATHDGVLLYSYAGTNVDENGKEANYNPAFYSALAKPSEFSPHPPFADIANPPISRAPSGIVKGFTLTDPWLAPVVGATVRLSGPVTRQMRSDVTGFFAFANLPSGHYTVAFDDPHFQPHRKVISVDGSTASILNYWSNDGRPSGRTRGLWTVTEADEATVTVEERTGTMRRLLKQSSLFLPLQKGDIVVISDLLKGLQPAIRLVDFAK